MGVIRCRFIFSGKNDGLTPDFLEVQSIKSYLGTVAAGFQREFERFEAQVSKQAADMDEDTRDRYMEDCAETADELTRHFPTFAWQTSFVAIYTLLEDDMLSIARTLGTHLGITLEPDDLKDKGIFAAKKYLESLCGITFPERDRPWQEVLHYNRLRNVIVHSRGRVRRKNEAIRNYVRDKKSKSLTIDNLDRRRPRGSSASRFWRTLRRCWRHCSSSRGRRFERLPRSDEFGPGGPWGAIPRGPPAFFPPANMGFIGCVCP
ncbi:MAG: hypothetical protein WBX00_33075 [Isosphaeraceae bacterium]